MKTEYLDRIRCAQLRKRVTGAHEAATWIKDGMTVGMSGFTRAGDVKLVPSALAERAKLEPLKITLLTGASHAAEAQARGGQTPHVLEKAFAWHQRYRETGSMLEEQAAPAA